MDRPLYIPRGPERFQKPGGPEEWGTAMPLLHRSITDLREQELVAHVLNDVHCRDTLFNIKGMFTKGARILAQVPLHRLRKALPSDIDILVIPGGQAELSTAIQVKRFEAIVRMNIEGLAVVDVTTRRGARNTFGCIELGTPPTLSDPDGFPIRRWMSVGAPPP